MPDTSTGARLARFLQHERRGRLNGRHRAVDALHRRPNAPATTRLLRFLRIERGHRA